MGLEGSVPPFVELRRGPVRAFSDSLSGHSVNRGYRLRSMTMRPTMNATKALPSKTISIKVMTDKVHLLAL